MESLLYEYLGDATQFVSAAVQVDTALEHNQVVAGKTAETLDEVHEGGDPSPAVNSLNEIAGAIGAVGQQAVIVGGLITAMSGGIIGTALNAAGAAEQNRVAFTTLVGSATEADNILSKLADFSARTPFQLPGIQETARGLIQFGESGDEVIDTLTILGNAAAGTSSDLGMIGLIFNQIRGVGKLLTQDFRQLSTRGIISLQDIADHFGVTLDAAQEMLSGGKISFEDLKAIMAGLSEEGGRFEDMMLKQSETFNGMLSTARDLVGAEFRQLGKTVLPIGKLVVSTMVDLLRVVNDLPPGFHQAVILGGGVAFVLGTVTTAAGGAALSISKYTAAVAAMTAAQTAGTASGRMMAASLTATSVAAKATGIALAAMAGYAMGSVIADAVGIDQSEEMDAMISRMRSLNKELAEANAGRLQELVDSGNQEALKQEIKGVQFQLKKAQEEVDSYTFSWKQLQEAAQKGNTPVGSFIEMVRALKNPDKDLAQKNVEELTQKLKDLSDMSTQIDINRANKATQEFDPEASEKLGEFIEKMKTEMDVAEDLGEKVGGLSSKHRKLAEIANSDVDPAIRAQAEALLKVSARWNDQIEAQDRAIQEQERVRNAFQKTNEGFREQWLALTQGKEASREYSLTLQGFNAAQIRHIMMMEGRIDKLKEQKKAEQEAREEAERTKQELTQQGEALKRQFETPAETAMRSYKELKRLFDGGFIDKETATRAMVDLNESFAEGIDKARELGRTTKEALGIGVDEFASGAEFIDFNRIQGGLSAPQPISDQLNQLNESGAEKDLKAQTNLLQALLVESKRPPVTIEVVGGGVERSGGNSNRS